MILQQNTTVNYVCNYSLFIILPNAATKMDHGKKSKEDERSVMK